MLTTETVLPKVTITRTEYSPQGTFGTLKTESGFTCRTGELPWVENRQLRSCIPRGTYNVTWRESIEHGLCYHIEGIPNRTAIEIHGGNFCGDAFRRPPFRTDLKGCIALGQNVWYMNGQRALIDSQQALKAFQEEMKGRPFELTILDGEVAPLP